MAAMDCRTMGLKCIALTFLLVALTTNKSSVLGFSEATELRQVRSSILEGETLKGKTLGYIARNRITDPGVVISIENHLEDTELRGGRTYEEFGKEKYAPPHKIEPRTQEIMAFDRRRWGQGASGLVAYTIRDSKRPVRFLITFSVPWSHLFSRNWYGLRVIDDDEALNSKLFSTIYHKYWYSHTSTNDFAYAKSDGKVKIHKGAYTITASMTTSKRAILRVKVSTNHDDK